MILIWHDAIHFTVHTLHYRLKVVKHLFLCYKPKTRSSNNKYRNVQGELTTLIQTRVSSTIYLTSQFSYYCGECDTDVLNAYYIYMARMLLALLNNMLDVCGRLTIIMRGCFYIITQ